MAFKWVIKQGENNIATLALVEVTDEKTGTGKSLMSLWCPGPFAYAKQKLITSLREIKKAPLEIEESFL